MSEQTEATIRVGVRGVEGRMGREVRAAVDGAPGLDLVCGVDVGAEVGELFRAAEVQVAVDFTVPAALAEGIPAMLRAGAHVVVGTSGVTEDHLCAWRETAREQERNVLVVPNFCVGIVLLQRFAVQAARFYADIEIVEMHHEKKVDSPSGTAADTARRIGKARGQKANANRDESAFRGGRIAGVPVHSVRLPGLLAHQVVSFGGPGEVLSIRHDTTDRKSFMPGVLLAIRRVGGLRGVRVGLENCLPELEAS